MSVYVAFIGGWKSTQADMDLWTTSARNLCDGVIYDAYPYPDVGPSDTEAVGGFAQFNTAVKRIQATDAETVFIVGHSSGCAIANELNSRLKDDPHPVTLIDLDGFGPNRGQLRKGQTAQAWHAIGAGGVGKSLHCPDPCAAYNPSMLFHASFATNIWSLHFSLVNSAATDAITKDTYKNLGVGYAGCVANLCWLP